MSIIRTVDLTKRFDQFVANDHINLTVEPQEIKCIVGENGAGKSTLMNMLYGSLTPSEGSILIDEKPVQFKSPLDAMASGCLLYTSSLGDRLFHQAIRGG